MKLKRLEVAGFKSFLEKTNIEFPAGISAIVGPNGCGKSNIVDALQWVMGEQSVKQLRGKSMEDVIFSGSDGKPPLNMAEVSLTVLNDNGTVPEELRDFTEIMVTRRLYRSGESAYFLNKQPCRLKDIHNLFMGSGMGSKTYAVIQQGNIGAITDAGPDERRLFIEEAAGITRYKNRKNEALRKLESTNQNLLRVSDIISEVKRQMGSLKRQAKKAERYKEYQDRIKALDIRLTLTYYNDHTQQIDKTDTLLKSLKDIDIEHTTNMKKLDAAVEDIKHRRWQKNQEISEQKSLKFETQRNIDRTENDLEHLRKEVDSLAVETAELASLRSDIEEKNRNIMTEISQVEQQNENLKEEIKTGNNALHKEREALETVTAQLATLNETLEKNKTDLMDLMTQGAQYKNIYQTTANNRESLRKRLKSIETEKATAERTVAEIHKNEKKIKIQIESLSEDIEGIDKRIEITKGELEQKNKSLAEHIKFAQTLEIERNKARSSHGALKKMEDNFEWYKDGVKAIMKRARGREELKDRDGKGPAESKANDIIGLMADIIEPESSYETAVEVVLGESLQYILVKDQPTALGEIEYLQTTGAGRGGFVPVSAVKQIEWDMQEKPNPTNLLLNHIRVKPGFEKIADTFLGHVIVADSLQEALNIFNRNGMFQTVVTREGDMISLNGILVGGSKENLSGIFTKKQEIKSLEARIQRLDQKLDSAHRDQKELESTARTIENNLQKLIEQKNKTTQSLMESEKALYRATEELKHARRHLDIVCLEQEQLLGEESDIDDELSQFSHVIAEIEKEVKIAQDRVSVTAEKIQNVSSQMEMFNQKVVDLQLKLTSLNARSENSNSTLRRLREFEDDGVKRLEQISNEIIRKNEKRANSKKKISEYEQHLSSMYDKLRRLEEILETNEIDYQTIDAALKEKDNVISEIQSKREETLEKIRLLELERSQWHIRQENLVSRLEERYQRPLSELKMEIFQNSNQTSEDQPMSTDAMEEMLADYKNKILKIEDVNLGAIKEFEQLKARFEFLIEQHNDLVRAMEDLNKVIRKINRITQERFIKAFNLVNEKLIEVFPRLFEGGAAKLVMTQPDKPLETGVEFMIHPPGKKLTRMSLLSGGEKALSAIAFIFSIFLIKPASFCLMDEIDAPLDDANIYRFNNLVKVIGEKSQIIMVTHNKKSMEFADTLFGITMETKGISKIVSVNLERPIGSA